MCKASFLTITLVVIVLFTNISIAAELYVPADYATIQAAIDASSNGDTIIIAIGTYTGSGNKNLDFAGKSITVQSTNPSDSSVVATTIIDCENSGRGFYFHTNETANSIIDGITIKNGRSDNGAGILCSGASPSIKNCVITNNGAVGSYGNPDGGAAYGGAISCQSSSNVILTNCTIIYNSTSGGNGQSGGSFSMAGNGGAAYGGGIYCSSSSITVNNCIISNNIAVGGSAGAAGAYGGASGGPAVGGGILGAFTVRDSIINYNQARDGSSSGPPFIAGSSGGGLYGCNNVINCLITNNNAGTDGADGLNEYHGGGVCGGIISNCTIYGNSISYPQWGGGGGVYGGTVINSIIWSNVDDVCEATVTYCCISDIDDNGTGVIHSDPLFVAGPDGNYYLSQIAAGQSSNSPCVDAGSDTVKKLGMDILITKTNDMPDEGIVDMGYHYNFDICSSDLSNDAFVDFLDFSLLAGKWQFIVDPLVADNCDIIQDSLVNIYDLTKLCNDWLECFVTKAIYPIPSNNAGDMSRNIILQWSCGQNAISHDVYLGTDFNEVANADIYNPAIYMGNRFVNYWDTNNYSEGLQYSKTYYWRIDEVAGCSTKGDVWKFSTSSYDINAGLVDWWKIDEGQGGGVSDCIGGNDGTISGPTWTVGKIDYALIFDGGNDYVDCGRNPSNYDNITISVWMKSSANTVLISNRQSSLGYGPWYTLRSHSIELGDQAGYTNVAFHTQTLDGLWHHIVYTKNGSNHAIYVDGLLDQNFAANVDISCTNKTLLGRANDYFYGTMDDVRIYNRALIGEEVLLLYNSCLYEAQRAFNPNPSNAAINMSLNLILSWAPGPNAVTHDIYFGIDLNDVNNANISSTGVYMGNQEANSWNTSNYASDLNLSTTYYWRIDEVNAGNIIKGYIWRFTTIPFAPGVASNPVPVNGANDIGISTTLSWTAGDRATSHDIYFGTVDPPPFKINRTVTNYVPSLDTNTTYYWRIDEKNAGGTTPGEVWSFTTVVILPTQATNPVPADLAVNVTTTTDLSWYSPGGYKVRSQDVYFGKTYPPPFVATKSGTSLSYDTGTMDSGTTYYWRIDTKNNSGTTTGIDWSFTTLPLPDQASNPAPANGAIDINITTDISWTAGSNAASHDVYFGTVNPPPFKVNQTATTYDTGTMDTNTTYYWRIDEKNASGTTTGGVWSFTTSIILPSQAITPSPVNSAINIGFKANLSWTAGTLASSHDVYFGTVYPPAFMGNQSGTTYYTGDMNANTTYYWRIDEKNSSGITTGIDWSFTTAANIDINDPNLVAWWQFDEMGGTTVYDLIGGNNGTIHGNPLWVTGKIGGALDGDNNGDYVQVPDNSSLTPAKAITFAFWVYNRGVNGVAIFKYADCPDHTGSGSPGNSRAYYLGVNGSGTAYLWIYQAVSTGDYITSNYAIPLNQWHHIVMTFNNGQAVIYIDGQSNNTKNLSVTSIMNDAQPLIIGGGWEYCTPSFYNRFNGIIDDLRIYNRAIDANEVAILYQIGQ